MKSLNRYLLFMGFALCIIFFNKPLKVQAVSGEDVVNVAKGEIGFPGVPNKYTRACGTINGSYKYHWCHAFVSWCARQAGAGSLVPFTTGCNSGAEWFVKRKQWKPRNSGYIPKAGDIIYFDREADGRYDHVGIVTYVSGGRVHTIEGNVGGGIAVKYDGGFPNGYSITSGEIVGYGTPAYSDPAYSDPDYGGSYWVNLTDTTFRPVAHINNADTVDKVRFALWSTGDQGDIKWYDANYNGAGDFFKDINQSDFDNKVILCHIYIYGKNGSVQSIEMTNLVLGDHPKPFIKGVYWGPMTDTTFRPVIEIANPEDISNVRFAVWSTGDQSDLKWYDANYNGVNGYFKDINFSDLRTRRYLCHAYVYGKDGSTQSIALNTFDTYDSEGRLEDINGGTGSFSISGYAFDRSDLNEAVNIHCYLKDSDGKAIYAGGVTANKERTDVNDKYSVGSNHGFYETFPTSLSGTYTVEVSAINIGGGNSVTFLGSKTVTISQPVVHFDSCGGTTCEARKITNNEPYGTLPKTTRIGYRFDGWYTEKSGGNKVTEDNIAVLTSDQTLYAHWNECVHSYKETVTVTATCSQKGLKTYTCSICGDKYTEAVPMAEHTAVADKGRAATCTEAGVTEGSHCSECKTVLVEQKQIAAKGHTAVTDRGRTATCTESGLTEGSHCSVCKTVLVPQKQIAAKGHTPVTDKGRSATCTEAGLTEGSHCSECKTVLVAQKQIAAKGHTAVADKGKAATCIGTGLTEGSHCSVCKTVLVAQKQIAAKGHTAVTDKGRTATCTESGLTEGSRCSVCKTVLVPQKQIAAKGHTAVTDKGRAATCTTAGLTEGSHCSVCKTVLVPQKQIAIKGHTAVTDKGRAATCTGTGLTEGSHCSACGTILKAQETIKARGHVAEKKMRNVIEATCTSKGYSGDTYCQACGQLIKKGKDIPALEHSWDDGVITEKATCSESGVKTYTCTICLLTKTEDIPCSGHTGETETRNVVKATCAKEGYTGDMYCKACGEMISSGTAIAKTKHQWDAGKVTTKPTGVKKGVKTYTCKKCKTQRKESIKATGLKPGTKIKDTKSNGIYKVAKDGLSVEYTTPINKKKASVSIPDVVKYKGVTCKVTSIGVNAFKGNKYIKQVSIGNNVVSIGKDSFSGCKKLSTVTFGKKVASIGNNAFSKDAALAKLTLPASVKTIGSNAFADCKKLKNITIKTKLLTNKSVGAKAFKGTNSKPTISVPKSVYASYKKLLKTKGMSGKAKYKKF